jgi:glycosyltransferase involved in cell wall biosynthesis
MNLETPKRLRVLLSAYAIAPNHGSEPGIGWNVATRLAKYHDVTVLCGDLAGGRRTEKELQNYFQDHGPIPGLEVCYVPPSAFTRTLHWMHGCPGLWFLYYFAYKVWQNDAYLCAARMHARRPFELSHHLNMQGYREPGYLWRLAIPFFWGPICGAFSPPLKISLQTGSLWFCVRYLVNGFQRTFSHRAAKAARKASLTWTVTEDERRMIERWGGLAELQSDTGTSNISDSPRVRAENETLRLVWSGQHIPRKALPLALEAMARLPEDQLFHLDILGTGPKTPHCQALARRLRIEHMVTWHGQLTQPEALAVMSKADALLHTSICEATSTVVPEALSLGMPVICHDVCGMKTAVTDQCGIRVPLRDCKTSIDGFSRAIQELGDSVVYNRLSIGALQRAQEMTWDRKVARISEAYTNIMEGLHE